MLEVVDIDVQQARSSEFPVESREFHDAVVFIHKFIRIGRVHKTAEKRPVRLPPSELREIADSVNGL
jgi:hypothetical protein